MLFVNVCAVWNQSRARYDCGGAAGKPPGIPPEYGILIIWNVPKYNVDCGFESVADGKLLVAGDAVVGGFCCGTSPMLGGLFKSSFATGIHII